VVIIWIGTGSAYNVARLCGNSIGVPGIGEVEEESEGVITRPLGSLAEIVGFATGLGVGLGFKLRLRVGEDSTGIVNPHLGKKHDVILTAEGSGRSKSRTLLLRALLFSATAAVWGGSRMPGTKGVVRDGGGVRGRLLPALVGSELGPSPTRLRKNNFLAIPLPRPKLGCVRLLKTDPKRPFDFSLAALWMGVIPRVNAASELE